MEIRQIRLITFDAAGTLLSPHPSVGAVYSEVLSHHGVCAPAAELEDRFRTAFRLRSGVRHGPIDEATEREFWRQVVDYSITKHCPEEKTDTVFEELYATFASPHRWALKEDAEETLKTLRKRGYLLAILSNSDGRMRRVISEKGIGSVVRRIYLSSETGYGKPDKRAFQAVERETGVSGKYILHIGDSREQDLEGARSAGWNSFILKSGTTGKIGETEAIPNLRALLDLLPRANGG